MISEPGPPLDTSDNSIDSTETAPSDEAAALSSSPGSARNNALTTLTQCARRGLARWRPILAATLVVAGLGVPVGIYFIQYRPDQQIDDAAAHQAIRAASDGAIALLSYSYTDLDRDFTAAKSHLTGDFLAYYDKFSQQGLAPAAREGQLTSTVTVLRAAVAELHPDTAVVLLFLNQTTASKKKPETHTTASGVLVTLSKVNGSWLIEKFEPK